MESQGDKIDTIYLDGSLDYIEVSSMDTEVTKDSLSEYYDMDIGESAVYIRYYHSENREKDPEFFYLIKWDDQIDTAEMSVEYKPSHPSYDERAEIDETRNYIEKKVNDVAEFCRINVNWDDVDWDINYKD